MMLFRSILLLLMLAPGLFSAIHTGQADKGLRVLSGSDQEWRIECSPDLANWDGQPISSWLRVAPGALLELEIESDQWTRVDEPDPLPLAEGAWLAVSPPVDRLGQTVASLRVIPLREEDGHWLQLERLLVRVRSDRPAAPGRPAWSHTALERRAQDMLNPPPPAEHGRDTDLLPLSRYLVVVPNQGLQYIEPWVEWRRQCGHFIDVRGRSSIGDEDDWEAIREVARGLYWSEGLDHILLAGDMAANGGDWNVPSDLVPGGQYAENLWGRRIVSDHSISLMDGQDYFSDVTVGRWPASNSNQLNLMVNRQLMYEQAPLIADGDYLQQSLMIYDVSGAGSRRETSLAIRQHLLSHGFAEVDTIWNHRESAPQSPTLVVNAINAGQTFINYRGYGYRNAWNGPEFTSNHMSQLSNVGRFPLVTSIVCGGGDFGTVFYNPCLGEAFLRAGNVSEPTGAIAFIGPSEEDTHTKWNNTIDLGIYAGLLQEGTRGLGALHSRGKDELWHCFPNDREENWRDPGHVDQCSNVPFYFYCYNLLGDPGTELRMLEQTVLTAVLEHPLLAGMTQATVLALDGEGQPFMGARASLTRDGELVALGVSDIDGRVLLDFDMLAAANDYELVLHGVDCVPHQQSIQVETASQYLSLLDVIPVDEDSLLAAGDLIGISATLYESGSEGSPDGRSLVLSCLDEQVTVTSANVVLPATQTGDELILDDFQLQLGSNIEAGHVLSLQFDLYDDLGELLWTRQRRLVAEGPRLEAGLIPTSPVGPGLVVTANLSLFNGGPLALEAASARLYALNTAATIEHPLLPGVEICSNCSNMMEDLSLALDEQLLTGSQVPFELVFFREDGSTAGRVPFQLTVGEQQLEDPLGPDGAGYIFIHQDDDHPHAPEFVYNDIADGGTELDLEDAGEFFNAEGLDGVSTVIDLPFTLRFYGQDFDQLTVCSNGWVAPGDQWEHIIGLNTPIPAAQGPEGMIAVFWTDLYNFYNGTRFGHLYTAWDQDEGLFTIQWDNFHHTGNPWNDNWFQLVIRDPEVWATPTGDAEMLFYYDDIITSLGENLFTVGVEHPELLQGLQYTFNGEYGPAAQPVSSGTALLLTTIAAWEETEVAERADLPQTIQLGEAWPNPFNPMARIRFSLPHPAKVRLQVFDLGGSSVAELARGSFAAGEHELVLDGTGWSSGLYFVTLEAAGQVHSRKVMLLK